MIFLGDIINCSLLLSLVLLPATSDKPVVPHSLTCAATNSVFKSKTVVSYFAEILPVQSHIARPFHNIWWRMEMRGGRRSKDVQRMPRSADSMRIHGGNAIHANMPHMCAPQPNHCCCEYCS